LKEKNLIDLVNYRKEKAIETIKEIKLLLDEGLLSLAMNRIYYAGFYIVNSLALLDGFSTSKHRLLIGYFNKNYIHTNKFDKELGRILNLAYQKRNSVDYQDFATISKDEVLAYFEQMKLFVQKVSEMIDSKLIHVT